MFHLHGRLLEPSGEPPGKGIPPAPEPFSHYLRSVRLALLYPQSFALSTKGDQRWVTIAVCLLAALGPSHEPRGLVGGKSEDPLSVPLGSSWCPKTAKGSRQRRCGGAPRSTAASLHARLSKSGKHFAASSMPTTSASELGFCFGGLSDCS